MKSEMEHIKDAVETLNSLEQTENVKIFTRKGKEVITGLLKRYEKQIRVKNLIEETVDAKLHSFESRILDAINNGNQPQPVQVKSQPEPSPTPIDVSKKVDEAIEKKSNGWKYVENTKELKVLKYDNHTLTIMDDGNQKMANIDDGDNEPVTKEHDLEYFKKKVENL